MCRIERTTVAALGAMLAACLGCIQEMANQPRYEPLEPSAAFADGRSSRQPVPGTVAFLGYGSTLQDPTVDDAGFSRSGMRRVSDGVFLKLSYLFRM